MLELIGSVLSGGVTGLFGAGISSVIEYLKQKQKDQHELAMIQAERETLKLEIQGRERVADIQAETSRDIAESKAFSESLIADRASYSTGNSKWLVLVDAVRGLTRPVLTLMLVVLTSVLWFTTDDQILQSQIVATVLYVTTASILWWFGSRMKQPK